MRTRHVALVALSTLVLVAAGCGGGGSSGVITTDGSSTVGPFVTKAAEDFKAEQDVDVTVGISGTGGGFERFCAGETDLSNASRRIDDEEVEPPDVRGALAGGPDPEAGALGVEAGRELDDLAHLELDRGPGRPDDLERYARRIAGRIGRRLRGRIARGRSGLRRQGRRTGLDPPIEHEPALAELPIETVGGRAQRARPERT